MTMTISNPDNVNDVVNLFFEARYPSVLYFDKIPLFANELFTKICN